MSQFKNIVLIFNLTLQLYFHKVLQFNNVYAGVILFIGQIADGISTLFVGFFSDRGDDYWLCRKFGRRKSWHVLGTVCVVCTFPFIFLGCVDCEDSDQYAQMIYYASFVVIFQFGWAAIQISHLAMIPELVSTTNNYTKEIFHIDKKSNGNILASSIVIG